MKSSVIERSSSFEDALWMALKKTIADRQPLSDREFANLSAAIRLFSLGFYQDQQGEPILPIISGGSVDQRPLAFAALFQSAVRA